MSHEIEVEVLWDDSVQSTRQRWGIREEILVRAARTAAQQRGFRHGQLGVRITDDPTIHQINVQHLHHDYPTDVISFPYQRGGPHLEGELVASLDTAASNTSGDAWTTADELTLYVIHGVLHIAGMEDHDPVHRRAMRAAEKRVLSALGIDARRAGEEYAGE